MKTFIQDFKAIVPGTLISCIVGLAALFLALHYGAPAMLFALLLGLALGFLYQDEKCKLGIDFVATKVLKVGVALLGLRIAFSDLQALGWQTALLLLIAVASTILLGILLAKALGMDKNFGMLTGGSVGICGASAAMAISAVMPDSKHKERDTLLTIIGVTSLSTIAMVIYPIIAGMLGLDDKQSSIFLGGTIHDVAQVVGAGYSVSEQTGDLATLTKLVRVTYLMPVVLCIVIILKRSKDPLDNTKTPGFPPFLIAFVVLMGINSVMDVPPAITASASEISRFALVVAIAAIGMKSNLSQIASVGFKPIIILVSETVWIALFILSGIYFWIS